MSTFTAQFFGTCAKCENTIAPGQTARYGAFDEVVHLACPTDPTQVRATGICPECFLEIPASGICGTCP